ncbi:hypothetical protein R7892_10090 [Ligilactobacillus murinus]|uniref:AbrB/MazE/SpoVT family DNA-binding domain-containing protein n=1 Tax=Ligilactobacillus murinus TaxID=1622 RepID=UPI00296B0AAD|nr:hypothetical protein [Ligilactobacillus murinus]WOY89015.1 hypothetical protein R7892_10090 [Ligilactobacillus murinus]
MAISVNIRQWGNSNIIRLPQKLLSSLGDNYNSFSAEVKDGKLLLTPISKDKVNSLVVPITSNTKSFSLPQSLLTSEVIEIKHERN